MPAHGAAPVAVCLTLSFSLFSGLKLGLFEGYIGLAGVALPAAARVYVEIHHKQ